MILVKTSSGRLEQENFFMNPSAADFLSGGSWSATENGFTLSEGIVKRHLPYSEFMLDIRKDAVCLDKDEVFSFFIESQNSRMGLIEEGVESKEYWRFIYNQNFAQIYTSDDGQNFENHGGEYYEYNEHFLQGFEKQGDKDLTLKTYNLYKSPFLTIQNFQPGTIAQIHDRDGNLIKQRTFRDDFTCEIFLDYCLDGYLEFHYNGDLMFRSDIRFFEHGDTFLFCELGVELLHQDVILENQTTILRERVEELVLRNITNKVVNNLILQIVNSNPDKIELSLDGNSYNTKIVVGEIKEYADVPLFLRIMRKQHFTEFRFEEFQIDISLGGF